MSRYGLVDLQRDNNHVRPVVKASEFKRSWQPREITCLPVSQESHCCASGQGAPVVWPVGSPCIGKARGRECTQRVAM